MAFSEEVIRLHDIARLVEQQLGVCELSKNIRTCADQLSQAGKELK